MKDLMTQKNIFSLLLGVGLAYVFVQMTKDKKKYVKPEPKDE